MAVMFPLWCTNTVDSTALTPKAAKLQCNIRQNIIISLCYLYTSCFNTT